MKTSNRQTQVIDQKQALGAYLGELLDLPATALEASPSAPAEALSVSSAPSSPAGAPSKTVEDILPTALSGNAAPVEASVPHWAVTDFQALLFEVVGLRLAVPLAKLHGVVNDCGEILTARAHLPLCIGQIDYQGRQSQVVDTARVVLPAQRSAQLESIGTAARFRHLVLIDEGRWALGCARVGEVIDLRCVDINWRGAGSQRLWLAGTATKHGCAVLDVDQLSQELAAWMA